MGNTQKKVVPGQSHHDDGQGGEGPDLLAVVDGPADAANGKPQRMVFDGRA
jgi:hypothetical protein